MELTGKLTPKSLGWDRNNIGTAVSKVPALDGEVLLGRIAGKVTGIKEQVNGETGDIMTGLKGDFQGMSSLNNKVVSSGVCYLPGGIQDMLEGAYSIASEKDPRATVAFTIDLYAIPATNKAGYSFKADSLKEANAEDPMADMFAAAALIKPFNAEPVKAIADGTNTTEKLKAK